MRRKRDYVHPYADTKSPYDQWCDLFSNIAENSAIYSYEVISALIERLIIFFTIVAGFLWRPVTGCKSLCRWILLSLKDPCHRKKAPIEKHKKKVYNRQRTPPPTQV
jgi:hypothetical protein